MSDQDEVATLQATLEGEYAGFVTRTISFVVDILIINISVLAVTGVAMLIFNFFETLAVLLPGSADVKLESATAWLLTPIAVSTLLIMFWLYPVIFWMINGQTVGKRIMGLRVVRMDGSRMTFWRGMLRVFGYLVAALPLFIGFIWVLFSDKRRGWHDILANTCVIYSWDARGSSVLRGRLQRMGDKRRNSAS